MRTRLVFLLLSLHLPLIFTAAVTPDSSSKQDQRNLCILKHMLTKFAGNDTLSMANIATMFDGVTKLYHKKTPEHITAQPQTIVSNSVSI